LNLQYLGYASRWDEIVLRGSTAEHSFSAFYLREGRVRACLSVNRFPDQAAARRLISAGTPVDGRRLADETVEIEQLTES
jgi:3-phenylpropionate/trans-cinnamate dioxygenase ferredoxin reductase subunit